MENEAVAGVLKKVKADGVSLVELQFVDIFGTVKSITIPACRLEDVFNHGATFDGSSIEGYARIQESDLVLVPDPATYALLPWRPREHAECRFICDVTTPAGGRRHIQIRTRPPAFRRRFPADDPGPCAGGVRAQRPGPTSPGRACVPLLPGRQARGVGRIPRCRYRLGTAEISQAVLKTVLFTRPAHPRGSTKQCGCCFR